MDPTFNPDLLQQLVVAAKSGQWALVAGFAIMLIVWASNWAFGTVLKGTVPRKYLPTLTAGTAMLAAVAVGLVSGVPWWQALMAGLLFGTSASGFWSLVGKHLSSWFKSLAKSATKKGEELKPAETAEPMKSSEPPKAP